MITGVCDIQCVRSKMVDVTACECMLVYTIKM